MNQAANTITLSANDLGAGFTSSDFRYEIWFVAATGTVEVKVTQVHFSAEIGLTTQKLSNGREVPGFNIRSVNVDLPTDHMDISLHGNFIS